MVVQGVYLTINLNYIIMNLLNLYSIESELLQVMVNEKVSLLASLQRACPQIHQEQQIFDALDQLEKFHSSKEKYHTAEVIRDFKKKLILRA